MNDHVIESLLHHQLHKFFCGVWASDQLPLSQILLGTAYFIVNTCSSHLPEEH